MKHGVLRLAIGILTAVAATACSSIPSRTAENIPFKDAALDPKDGIIFVATDFSKSSNGNIQAFGCTMEVTRQGEDPVKVQFHIGPAPQGSLFRLPPGVYDLTNINCGGRIAGFGDRKKHGGYSGFHVESGRVSILGAWWFALEGQPLPDQAHNHRLAARALDTALSGWNAEFTSSLLEGYSRKSLSPEKLKLWISNSLADHPKSF